jgi:uncharacterized protein (DUF1684 family)
MKTTILASMLLAFSACTLRQREGEKKTTEAQATSPIEVGYRDSILAWRAERNASLKADDGWLNLAGLFWLAPGENSVGSTSDNHIRFPAGKSDAFVGNYTLEGDSITFTAARPNLVKVKGQNGFISSLQVFPSDSTIVLSHRNLEWFIIDRGDKIGVRLRDLDSDLAKSFTSVPTYEVDQKWRVRAKFIPTPSRTINIVNVLDQSNDQKSPGILTFSLAGKNYRLDALKANEGLFIIFGDQTNGDTTYDAGRFLYTDSPNAEGNVWLDFNKAYNPPCAFTPYSTCPLPPKQNILPIPVMAGEKKFKKS